MLKDTAATSVRRTLMGAKATPATLGLSVLTTQPPASVTHAEVAPMAFMETEPFAEVCFFA